MSMVKGVSPNAWAASRAIMGATTGMAAHSLLRQDKGRKIDWPNLALSGLVGGALLGLTKGSLEGHLSKFFSKYI